MIAQIPVLRAHALMLTGSGAAADDLVQDALMRAWRFRSGFEPGTNLRAWMFRILRNEFFTRIRKDGRVKQVSDFDFLQELTVAPEQEWGIRYADLLNGLDTLHADQKEVLLLLAAGNSYDEIAEICECPLGTVKSRVHRARDNLLKVLDGADNDHHPQPDHRPRHAGL